MQYSCRTYILRGLHRSGFALRQAKPQWLQKIHFLSNSQGAIEWTLKWNGPNITGAALQYVTLWGSHYMLIETENTYSQMFEKGKSTLNHIWPRAAELQPAAFLWTHPDLWRHSRCFPLAANGKIPAEPVTSLIGAGLKWPDAWKCQNHWQYGNTRFLPHVKLIWIYPLNLLLTSLDWELWFWYCKSIGYLLDIDSWNTDRKHGETGIHQATRPTAETEQRMVQCYICFRGCLLSFSSRVPCRCLALSLMTSDVFNYRCISIHW